MTGKQSEWPTNSPLTLMPRNTLRTLPWLVVKA